MPSSHPISLSLQIDGRLRYGLGVVRLLRPTGGMVPSAPDAWPSRVVAPTPGPVFIQDQSASGKRDSSAQRQTSQKSPPGQKRCPRRPKSSRKCPPFAGFLAVSGKSRGSKECVVDLRGFELRARHAVLSNRSLRSQIARLVQTRTSRQLDHPKPPGSGILRAQTKRRDKPASRRQRE